MKTFVVTGIQMRNKGSQAMFLSLYYALKSTFPNCEVVGFANKYDAPEQYSFRLLPYDDYTRTIFRYRLNKVPLLEPLLTQLVSRKRKTRKWNGKVAQMEKALRKADAIFDASGYTLGSGWSKEGGELLLETIRLARRYNKKIVLMPQSFGPFDWEGEDTADFLREVKKQLSYCSRIFAREREGYDCLTALGLDNVDLSTDMVIREKSFPTAAAIKASGIASAIEYPAAGSVGFIINENVFRIGNPEAVLGLYANILDKLVDSGENVFILTTSTADNELVNDVLARSSRGDKVCVISGEYSSPELIEIISKFKYVIASRYHSIVFAYRSGVPAIILGWASKYIDLADHFEQQDYVFDIREPGVGRIIEQLDMMSANYENEAHRIRTCLERLQSTSVVREALSSLQASALPTASGSTSVESPGLACNRADIGTATAA